MNPRRTAPDPSREESATEPMRSRLSLRQLEAFCTVAIAGGVSAAARRLSRTQSAVSTSVAELEATLGTALFERVGRGLRATDAARRLLPRALEVVERAHELPALAAGLPGQPERLRIGASRTIGPFLMPPLLARLCAQRPQVQVELAVANTGSLLERLRRFELDVAFVEGDVLAPGLVLVDWRSDALCLFARAGHPLARRFGVGASSSSGRPATRQGPVYARALADARWALREPGSGSRETFLRAIAPAIGAPRVGITVDEPLAMVRVVAEGDWIGCLSRRAVDGAIARRDVVELPAPGAAVARALARRFWIVRLPDRYRSAALDALLALALETPVPVPEGARAARRAQAPRRTQAPRSSSA